MILGTFLVLISWIFLLLIVLVFGQAILMWLRPQSTNGNATARQVRMSLWWGLLVFITLILAINVFLPLNSGLSAGIVLIVFVLGLVVVAMKRSRFHWVPITGNLSVAIIIATLFIAWVVLAHAALGPVTNYDTGLYHLGAIKYSSEYSTIPGLANLFSPFGYNTSLYPFAAFLGNGPWGAEGFRLANGFIFTLVIIDLIIRLLASRGKLHKLSVGSWILLVGTLISLVPMVTLSDYWITSPSSDASVMVLTLIACSYLADGLWKRSGTLDFATSFVVAVILFSLRPTMTVFLIGILIATAVWVNVNRKHEKELRDFFPVFLAGFLGLGLLGIQTVRDYILSGWIQFPLGIYSFNTPWTTIDAEELRMATLGTARNPEDLWGSIEGFAWVEPWIRRLPDQWEPFLIGALALATVILAITIKLYGVHVRLRLMTLLLLPSFMTTIVWFFFAPPSFRFGWGPIFSLFIIPIGVFIQGLMQKQRGTFPTRLLVPAFMGVLVVGLFTVTVYTATVRLPKLLDPVAYQFTLGTLQIQYQATPVVTVPVVSRDLSSGLTVEKPITSDQCWNNYPLCTPIISESVTMRGESIQEGFLP